MTTDTLRSRISTREVRLGPKTIERHWTDGSITVRSTVGKALHGPFEVIHNNVSTDQIMISKAGAHVCYGYNGSPKISYLMSCNDFGFMPKGSSVAADFKSQIPALTIEIPDALRNAFLSEHQHLWAFDEPTEVNGGLPNAALYARLIDDFLEHGGIGGSLRIESMVNLLLEDIVRARSQTPDSTGIRPLPHSTIVTIKEYIDSHMDERIDLATLAQLANTSQFHFSRQFKIATGSSPHQFVTQHRLEKVRSLLRNTEISLSEISVVCGFSSQSHMSTVFRKALGLSPGEFRKISGGRSIASRCTAL